MNDWKPGDDECPECGGATTYALDENGEEIYIHADPGGDLFAEEDGNRIQWCRPIPPGTQLAFGDERYSLHVCPLAEVIPLTGFARQPESARRYA